VLTIAVAMWNGVIMMRAPIEEVYEHSEKARAPHTNGPML
jgi:hypothetical protein